MSAADAVPVNAKTAARPAKTDFFMGETPAMDVQTSPMTGITTQMSANWHPIRQSEDRFPATVAHLQQFVRGLLHPCGELHHCTAHLLYV
jgi:hypothetical protein